MVPKIEGSNPFRHPTKRSACPSFFIYNKPAFIGVVVYNNGMSIVYLLAWWYGSGWLRQWKLIIQRLLGVSRFFSVLTVIRTLFSPWKQLISHAPSNGINFQKMIDNMISRFVGLFIRIFTLVAAVVSLVVIGSLSVAAAIIWPVVPLFIPAAVLKGMGII